MSNVPVNIGNDFHTCSLTDLKGIKFTKFDTATRRKNGIATITGSTVNLIKFLIPLTMARAKLIHYYWCRIFNSDAAKHHMNHYLHMSFIWAAHSLCIKLLTMCDVMELGCVESIGLTSMFNHLKVVLSDKRKHSNKKKVHTISYENNRKKNHISNVSPEQTNKFAVFNEHVS